MAHSFLSPQSICILCLALLSQTSTTLGVGIPLPGLGLLTTNNLSSGSAQVSKNRGGLLANALGDSAAGLADLSNMGSDLSSMLQVNGGLSGLVSTIASNNQFVDMARQMPMSDSLGKVLNLVKSSIPDITTNGETDSENQGSQSSFNGGDVIKLLDQLGHPRGQTLDLPTGTVSSRESSQPPQRLSEAPNELVNNNLMYQQQQQQTTPLYDQNQMSNSMAPPALNSQQQMMSGFNQFGGLQPPTNMPLNQISQLPQSQLTQQMNLLLRNPSLMPQLNGQQSAAGATSLMPNLASIATPEVLKQLTSSGVLQNSSIPPEIINRLSSSGLLQNLTPQLINRLTSTGVLQNPNIASSLMNLLSSTGSPKDTNSDNQIMQQFGSNNIQSF